MKQYVISSFYKFIPLEDFQALKAPLLATMKAHNLFGTVILAEEGINGSVAGTPDNILFLYAHFARDPRLTSMKFKETFDDFMPFEKAKVKFRKEIVTLGIKNIDPLESTGIRVNPENWNALIQNPEVLVIDTRNDYEVALGAFQHAINPHTENFRDFPEYVEKNLLDKKDKKIAMYCTGGIRCEKSTAYLLSLGFKEVYQLEGGILNYIDSIPKKESTWTGDCFVFDERITLKSNT